ncbi:hypothetical protein LCGC14_2909750 [marine sediment metagenome]|uniref:Uncharacterized protein n=1 Tax=marine sediment metagenome TaxID=412755 RepID=A0A0F8YDW5_9ZZZZ
MLWINWDKYEYVNKIIEIIPQTGLCIFVLLRGVNMELVWIKRYMLNMGGIEWICTVI